MSSFFEDCFVEQNELEREMNYWISKGIAKYLLSVVLSKPQLQEQLQPKNKQ